MCMKSVTFGPRRGLATYRGLQISVSATAILTSHCTGHWASTLGPVSLSPGINYGPATKLSFYASLYLSGLFMYAFVYTIGSREYWPRVAWWALATATIYALTRYHLTDVFSRSVLAESWAWTALPGVYWGMEVTRNRPWPGILLVSVMYAGLFLVTTSLRCGLPFSSQPTRC